MGLTTPTHPEAGGPRCALYGGAFDPPHLAHVRMVEALVAQCGIDRVWVVPTGQAWHKPRRLTDAVHRLAMARLAFSTVPQAVVDDRELRRAGPSYTVDTLAELHAEHPQAQWFLLMGEDQWAHFSTWWHWQRIAAMAKIVVAKRPFASIGEGQKHSKTIPGEPVSGLPTPVRLNWQPLPISSTALRERIPAPGATAVDSQLPVPVARYISEHALYTSPT